MLRYGREGRLRTVGTLALWSLAGLASLQAQEITGVNNWDFAVYKSFRTPWFGGSLMGEHSELQFRTEFFNVWNHTQFSGLDTTFGDPAFGRVVSVYPPREIQFGLKFLW